MKKIYQLLFREIYNQIIVLISGLIHVNQVVMQLALFGRRIVGLGRVAIKDHRR